MALLGSRGYDRARLLDRASRALQGGRRRRAFELYSQVLEHEPDNFDLQRRVAPLLATSGRVEEALGSYRIAAAALVRRGFVDHAVGVYREAAQRLPRERIVWEALADLEIQRGKPADANRALLEGSRHFRGRRCRSDAVALLRRARRLDRRHFETGLAFARMLAKSGARGHAAAVLAEMATWTRGRKRRSVRLRQLILNPGPGTAWRWLIAGFGR